MAGAAVVELGEVLCPWWLWLRPFVSIDVVVVAAEVVVLLVDAPVLNLAS